MGGDGLARPPKGRGGLAGPSGLIPVGLANLHTRAKVGKRLNLVHSINSTPLHSAVLQGGGLKECHVTASPSAVCKHLMA